MRPETRAFPGDERYLVVSDGTVLGLKGRPLKPQSNGKYGYLSVQLGRGRRWYVHRMVALTFIGEPGELEVDHRDGDPANNAAPNLRYLTHAENLRAQRERVTHCRRGHPFAGNEVWSRGRRTCLDCRRMRDRLRPPRRKAVTV